MRSISVGETPSCARAWCASRAASGPSRLPDTRRSGARARASSRRTGSVSRTRGHNVCNSRGGPDGNTYIYRNICDLRRGVFADRPTPKNPEGSLLNYHIFLTHGRPFLGICVGMQLMAERGLEHVETQGFGWIDRKSVV